MQPQKQIIEIFDRRRVRQNRNRAAGSFHDYDFLIKWTADNLRERLADIKRDFPSVLQIGTRGMKPQTLEGKNGAQNIFAMEIAESFLKDAACPAIQGDEESLPFAENSFDMVISALSLHTVNDLPGTLIQINRCLRPDGLFLGALLGGETLYELRHAMTQAEMNIKGGISPHIAPFADKQQLGTLMQRAGFALPVVDSELVTVTYDNVAKLMQDVRGMGEGSALVDRDKKPLGKKLLFETERIYRESFAEQDGRLPATFEIIFLIGWAPHKSQQKPLRPGSAENRLADALNTEETKV